MKKLLSFLMLAFVLVFYAQAQPTLTFSTFSTGYSKVIAIENCNDSRLFVVQQAGKIMICDSTGTKLTTPFLDITGICSNPSGVGDERGLLGLAFHPDYKNNGYFYLNYTAASGGATKIVRYSVNPNDSNLADPNSAEILLSISQPYSNHNGGTIRFGADGYLYIGMGDGGSGNDPGNRAQDKTQLLGKMLRINVDSVQAPLAYAIPPDNPFVGTANRGEIWSYGLRNPWKWSFDRIYNDLWIGDVGQNAWEEIDFEPYGTPGGRNYGWRCYEGMVTNNSVSQSGCPAFNTTAPPIFVFDHSTACSVTGGYIYRGAKNGSLYGYYVFTDYCDAIFRLLKRENDGTFTSYNLGQAAGSGDYVAFGEDYRGELYLADVGSNAIKKISTPDCLPTAAIISLQDTITVCSGAAFPVLSSIYHPENSYQWYKDGGVINGATAATFACSESGSYTVEVTNPSACTNLSDAVVVQQNIFPNVSFTGLDSVYCHLDSPSTLSGTPAGGTFSGNGVNGNTFEPQTVGTGSYVVTYTYINNNGCDTSVTQTTEVTICGGLMTKNPISSLQLFPNPNQGQFNLEYVATEASLLTLFITDITGKEVYSREIYSNSGNNTLTLNLTSLEKGFYMLKINNSKAQNNKAFVIY